MSDATIVKTPGICGGRARIDGHRIRVQDIAIAHVRQGMSVDEILHQYPSLNLAKVHAALAYFYDHDSEIWGEIEADRSIVEEFRRNAEQAAP